MPDDTKKKPLIQGKDLNEVYLMMKLQQRVHEFNGTFRIEGSKLVCVYCNEKFCYKQKHLLHRHIWSKSHLINKRVLKAKLVTVKANYESDHNDQSNSENVSDQQKQIDIVHKKKLIPQEKIQRYVKEFGNVLKVKDENLMCSSCNIKINHQNRSTVERHMATKFHARNVSIQTYKENGGVPPSSRKKAAFATAAQREFNIELCKVFLVSGVSISRLSHPIVQRFLNKYTTMPIPDHNTLRRGYWDVARTTLQAEARKLKEESLITRSKKPQAKGPKSKKIKRSEMKSETEDPLELTDEQVESILQLKKEPKEELIDESEPEVKEHKLKKRKQEKVNKKKEKKSLASTNEQLETILLLKEEPMDQLEPTDLVEDPLLLPSKEEPLEPSLEPQEESWD